MTSESESGTGSVINEEKPLPEAISEADIIKGSGFELDGLFRIAVKFYRENKGKAFQPSYDDRNYFFALVLQAKHGRFVEEKAPPLGALDLIGRDRRIAWNRLSSLSKEDAESSFIKLLHKLCPTFMPYVEAHKRKREKSVEEKELSERNTNNNIANDELEQRKLEEDAIIKQKQELQKIEEQRRTIQEALNRQTYSQFKAYAEQQYPNNKEQQEVLISQLQEQHYQQYMQQMYQHQIDAQCKDMPRDSALGGMPSAVSKTPLLNNQNHNQSNYQSTSNGHNLVDVRGDEVVDVKEYNGMDAMINLKVKEEEQEEREDEDEDEDGEESQIENAQLWTRKEIEPFKESIKKEGGEGIIKVGHGEIVTVRVPTHQEGTCIFWEFATDGYDIGFGLLFEWTPNPGDKVSVHITESEDEEEEEEEEEEQVKGGGGGGGSGKETDPEKGIIYEEDSGVLGGGPLGRISSPEEPSSVIIPIYRRDCHEEVYAGSHQYPGKGVYLLKFDNSYSLWRSKTLYYRVYYTK